jgi:PPOX class probable F420-dependent enzyme
MKLTPELAREQLSQEFHGVLSTIHPDRGPDAVPVVYAITSDDLVGIPIDKVKPKSSTRLQRERNLTADPRAVLLVQMWDQHDWSKLWWVRADLHWVANPEPEESTTLSGLLAERYEQYRDEPFTDVLVFRIANLTGWSASEI